MSSGTGVPQVAALNCQHAQAWSGNHNQSGYVFVLTNSPNGGGTCTTLVLLDRNRDGSIDSDGVLTPDDATWDSLGFWDGTTFSELY
jgi:hypothetical protein